jgi:recombination protein RecA
LPTAALLRRQIEAVLSARLPAALSPRARAELDRTPCGIAAIDELLQGGLPAGVVTEFVGLECSGRTALALAYVAAITHSGGVCAWVDVADALDPESVAANGVDLERLLWVRCGPPQPKSAPIALEACAGVAGLVAPSAATPRPNSCGSPHPRSEGRDMPQAIGAMLQAHGGLYDRQVRREKKAIGTPGAANRPLSPRSEEREEQVDPGRQPARRGDNLALAPRCAEPQPRRIASAPASQGLVPEMSPQEPFGGRTGRWQALDQALRSTDLLLQAGGFSAIVLDLGGTAPETAWRIPLATWFRFRAACERTRVSLVLLTQHPCARSSAELVVRLEPGTMEAAGKVLTGIRYGASIERNRSQTGGGRVVPIRKPPQSERAGQWNTRAPWVQAK